MKKFLNILISGSFFLLTFTACSETNNSNSTNPKITPTASASSSAIVNPVTPDNTNPKITPTASASASAKPVTPDNTTPAYSKVNVLAFLNCIKTKLPEIAPAIEGHISNVNAQNDEQWALNSSSSEGLQQIYASSGCKIQK
ncbi:MAG: hypothetical protein AABZ74_10755 [Cyanobacteriota bacterium]